MVATGQEMGSRVALVDHWNSCEEAVARYPRWLPDYLRSANHEELSYSRPKGSRFCPKKKRHAEHENDEQNMTDKSFLLHFRNILYLFKVWCPSPNRAAGVVCPINQD